jgi:drug/metabolite transporter (DMT)-like permease
VHLALFATMLVWGLNLSAVKLLTQSLDIRLVALLRMLLAAAVLALFWWRSGEARLAWPWRGPRLYGGLLCAFLLVYLQQMVFAAGLAHTSATNAALIMALGPFSSVLMEALAFRRRIGTRQWLGTSIALSGVALVVLNRPGAAWTAGAWGDLLILASVLSFAAGGVTMQKLARQVPTLSIGVFVHTVGAGLLLLHAALAVPAPLDAVQGLGAPAWGLIVFSGLFATALGSVAWARGIATLGVGRTAAYLSWVPVFGVGFGALLLGEALTPWHGLGVLAVLGGSTLAVRGRAPARQGLPAA